MTLTDLSIGRHRPVDRMVGDYANVDTTRYQTYTWGDRTNPRKGPSCPSPAAISWSCSTSNTFPAGESVVTKKEIVKTIAEEIGLTQLKTKEIVQKTFDAIVETLVEDRRIELRNFGVFEVKQRAARKARNPRTGEKVSVPEKFVVTFKPGKEMEERVRELERRAAEEAAERERAEAALAAGTGFTPSASSEGAPAGGPSQNGSANHSESASQAGLSTERPSPYHGYDASGS